MISFVGRRLLAAVPVVIGVSVVVFATLYVLPGDPVQALTGDLLNLDNAQIAALRAQLGLNDPAWVQYGHYAVRVLHGDLGVSLASGQPILGQILTFLPPTIQLTAAAMLFAVSLGVPLGTLAAIRAHTWVDSVAMLVSLGGASIPSFWLGLMLLLVFSVWLHWLPSAGTEGLNRLVLPAFTLGYGAAAVIARLTRSALLEALSQDYVTTARSKGLPEKLVVVRHALRNALIPVVTILGLQIGTLLSGAVIVESVFSRQGIGRMLVNGILAKDLPLVQGTILFVATTYVLVNILTDVVYAWVDPRIRQG